MKIYIGERVIQAKWEHAHACGQEKWGKGSVGSM